MLNFIVSLYDNIVSICAKVIKARFLCQEKNCIFQKFNSYNRAPIYIKDEEFRFVDGLLDNGIDSTELANDCEVFLASLDINGKKIRIYSDIDCDCGVRRNKRDKSVYVIGYRLHTYPVIDAKTGNIKELKKIGSFQHRSTKTKNGKNEANLACR